MGDSSPSASGSFLRQLQPEDSMEGHGRAPQPIRLVPTFIRHILAVRLREHFRADARAAAVMMGAVPQKHVILAGGNDG